jgi:hypothetical protein
MRRDIKHGMPTPGPRRQNARQRHQQRCRPFGGIQHAVVRGGELPAINIGAGRREQRVDLAPGEEHDTGQDHEQHRIVGEVEQRIDADAFREER